MSSYELVIWSMVFVHCYSKNVQNTVTVSTFCNETPLTIHTQLSVTQPNTWHYCTFNFGPMLGNGHLNRKYCKFCVFST